MPSVDIVLPELGRYDATANHTLLIRDLLIADGVDVRIVVERQTTREEAVTLLADWDADADLVILQHAIGSEAANEVVKRRLPMVVNYHNVTPTEFVEAWDPQLVSGLRWGRAQLHQLAPLAIRGVADSDYNAAEMRAARFDDVAVVPVLWQLPEQGQRASDPIDDGGMVLFVGRLAPNKCPHDLISALALLLEVRPAATLVLVGSAASPRYHSSLLSLADRLGIANRVHFTGSVSEVELIDWYSRADVFCCASEHEGFCVPIVEAMHHGVPVVAYGAAAVPETVQDAGILLGDKSPATLASAIDTVLSSPQVARTLRSAGHRRALDFRLEITQNLMRQALDDLLGARS
ncbi:MAG: glycosyltransferase family 4 protein [Acidimicrobiaceae bacterium]|nr:glycosyltransferase family 4 protein [Acidimicrobiaceae bacterium]